MSGKFQILAINRWFSFNFAKTLKGRQFAMGGPKASNFYQIFILTVVFKKMYCQVYGYFRDLIIKLILAIFNKKK